MITFKTLDIFSGALFFTDLKARAQAFKSQMNYKLEKFFKNSYTLLCLCRYAWECLHTRFFRKTHP